MSLVSVKGGKVQTLSIFYRKAVHSRVGVVQKNDGQGLLLARRIEKNARGSSNVGQKRGRTMMGGGGIDGEFGAQQLEIKSVG